MTKLAMTSCLLLTLVLVAGTFASQSVQSPERAQTQNLRHAGEPSKSLHLAAAAGDLEQVRSLIGSGANVNLTDRDDATPVYLAARNGHAAVVEVLLDAGAYIDAARTANTIPDFTPLYEAAKHGHSDVAELLLARGADPNVETGSGDTALTGAIARNDTAMMELLLDHGVDLDAEDRRDYPPLFHALSPERKEAFECLLARGADINVRDRDGQTLLHSAALRNRADLVELLIARGVDANAVDNGGWTALDHAVAYAEVSRKDAAALLASKGIPAHTRTGLHVAAYLGDLSKAKDLVADGTDVNVKDKDEFTPLHYAALEGHVETARFLLVCGAEVNAKDVDGCTPLHLAAFRGHANIARLLVDKGADLRAPMSVMRQGRIPVVSSTPLHEAIRWGHADVAEALLSRGTAVNEPDGRGDTPLALAMRRREEALVKLLVDRGGHRLDEMGPNARAALNSAIWANDATRVERLIATMDLNSSDRNGYTALHNAVQHGRKDVVVLLVGKGADIQARTHLGESPLDVAATYDNAEAAEVLLAHGADPNVAGGGGCTALHYAAKSFKGGKDVAELLLRHGAKVDAEDDEGWTPLHLAAREGNAEVVELLIRNGADVNATPRVSLGSVLFGRREAGPRTPLYQAVESGHKDVAELLLAYGAQSDRATDDLLKTSPTALHEAAEKGDVARIRSLVGTGVDTEAKDRYGWTALHIAARDGRKNVAEALLDGGADANAEAKGGVTVLDYAVASRNRDLVDLLLARGATPNLYAAAFTGDLAQAKAMLAGGARASDKMPWHGGSALHFAANREVAELLMAHGALVKARDHEHWTALHYASQRGDGDTVRLLLVSGAEADAKSFGDTRPLRLAVAGGHRDVAEQLLAAGADVNAADPMIGWTPLHFAISGGDRDMVAFLVSHGADVNAKDEMGRSPLARARQAGREEIVQLLREHGAQEP